MLSNFDRVAEKYDNIELENIKIYFYNLNKGYEDCYRSYGYYRFCSIVSGKKEVSINNGEKFFYDNSQYILLPPESKVNMKIATDTKAIVYEISPNIIDKVSDRIEKNLFKDEVVSKKDYSKGLLKTINNLNENMYKSEKEMKFLMDLYAQELVYRIIEENKEESVCKLNNYYNLAQGAKDIIEKPGNETLSINEIADILGMSHSNLNYYFRKEFNITPKKYQNQIKIERAKYLLKENNVTEVAMSLGFDNISYFIRLFKDTYGITPKQYGR